MSLNSNIRECDSAENGGRSAIRNIAISALVAVGVFFSLRATTQPISASAAASTSPVTVTKNIEDIEVGDLVLSRDEHGTTVAPRPVKEVYRRTSFHLRNLTFSDDSGHEQTLQTTDEHPFWCVSDNAFVDAETLQIGSKVTSPDGDLQTLIATTRDERPAGVAVFNFQVDGFHTYYVAAARNNILLLAHNSECGDLIYRGGRSNPGNLTPRPSDDGVLSFRDSLSNPIDSMTPGPLNGRAVFPPGSDYIAIDPSRLPVGTVIPDNLPPGHVSVIGPTVDQLKDAMTGRGSFP